MPMMYLILGFILSLTSLKEVYKGGVTILAFVSVFFYTLSIWLIRYIAPFFAFLLIISNIFLGLSFLLFFLVPLLEMWFSNGRVYQIFFRGFCVGHLD